MKKSVLFILFFATAGFCAAIWGSASAQPATDVQTQSIVAATRDFLQSLDAEQRSKVQLAFQPEPRASLAQFTRIFVGEKYGEAVWSNFPVSDVPRPGLTLGSLRIRQREAAMNVLKTILSPEGYQKVVNIMDSDQALHNSGTPYSSGTAFYTLAVLGTPSTTAPWMLQFGGHHLGLNVVIVGPNVTLSPTLTGDQPATFERNGETIRPLGKENDKAFELMNSLSKEQQQKATLNYQIDNLVWGPGQDGRSLLPEGLCASEMSDEQREDLMDLVGEWVNLLNSDDARPKLERIKANLGRTYFAWHGDRTNPSPIYFRITGPTLHIEFAHQGGPSDHRTGVQANGVNHIHTVYRDPSNEYGTAYTLTH